MPGAPRLLPSCFAKQSLSLWVQQGRSSAQQLIFNLPVAPRCKGSCQGGVAVDWSTLSPRHSHGWPSSALDSAPALCAAFQQALKVTVLGVQALGTSSSPPEHSAQVELGC